jgi:pimeloyl-ACP methyl ester carboxylesterase
VPRDYANETAGTLNIAVIKKPGSTPDAQEVLVNPGGPGGSSVNMVLSDYARIQAKIGSEYSLVGIDPRGINNSEPSSDCFPDYPFQTRNAFLVDALGLADITSEMALRTQHQSILAYGKWCSDIYGVNGTAKYASTVATAQDMLHYVKLRAGALGKSPNEAKLWYYGISYGSILGPTFASLYPERVGRMIIDGVLELEDYYNGGWEHAIDDSDKAAEYFFKQCFEAGPALCLFHQNATSWQDIERRYMGLLEELKKEPFGVAQAIPDPSNPFTVPGIPAPTPYVLEWTDIVSQFFATLYYISPTLVLSTDYALVALQNRDQATLSSLTLKSQVNTFNPLFDERMARALVVCLDSSGRSNYTDFGDYKAFVDSMHNKSNYGGLHVAALSGPVCSQMHVQPPQSQRFDGVPRVDGTHTPILFVSSVADPVTPLSSARKMNRLFPGSGLLVFDNVGVSLYSICTTHSPSSFPRITRNQHTAHFQNVACVSEYEKQYMRNGTLPPANTVCEVDEPNPWIAAAKLFDLAKAGST